MSLLAANQKNPTAELAYQAIAKLGGWSNSKRTGKASPAINWDGWFRLTERVEGFSRSIHRCCIRCDQETRTSSGKCNVNRPSSNEQ